MSGNRIGQFVLVIGLALVFVLVVTSTASACPNCKDALADNDPSYSGAVQGYFWSILLMLSTPILILAGLGSYFYWLVRQAKKSGYWQNAFPVASPAMSNSAG